MNDGFLVRVLHAGAYLNEQLQPLGDAQTFAIAVVGNGKAIDIFHRQVRLALYRGACVKDLGNGRVFHDREGLALRLKSLYNP